MAEYAKIFKAYDIRGLVPDELDEDAAEVIGAAFARLTGAASVVTVHDMRSSSGPLKIAASETSPAGSSLTCTTTVPSTPFSIASGG